MNLLNKYVKPLYTRFRTSLLILLTLVLTSCADHSSSLNTSNLDSNKGIVNGTRVIRRDAEKFASILRMSIDGNQLCTGTYMGNGYVLTAYHCVGLVHKLTDTDKPSVRLSSMAGFRSSRASRLEELEVYVPAAEKEMLVGGTKVPLPDIALLKFSGDFAKELEGIPAATLGTAPLVKDEKEVFIAGYGHDQFDREVSAVGLLNFGKVKVDKVEDIFVESSYEARGEFSAVLPGDSGGPLFKFDGRNLVVYGVASSVGYDRLEVFVDGTSTKANSRHSRTDKASVREWIECLITPSF